MSIESALNAENEGVNNIPAALKPCAACGLRPRYFKECYCYQCKAEKARLAKKAKLTNFTPENSPELFRPINATPKSEILAYLKRNPKSVLNFGGSL